MVPVCTADRGYRDFYTPDLIAQLRDRFGVVEAWCDCRNPTHFSEALEMCAELGLDGAWGQCENAAEFDNAFQAGAGRMVGQLSGLREDQRVLISEEGVHLAFELYRNIWPWQEPDYMGSTGVGSNCVGVYASASEGSTYYPISRYIAEGYYLPGRDSVYAVGLKPDDWKNL